MRRGQTFQLVAGRAVRGGQPEVGRVIDPLGSRGNIVGDPLIVIRHITRTEGTTKDRRVTRDDGTIDLELRPTQAKSTKSITFFLTTIIAALEATGRYSYIGTGDPLYLRLDLNVLCLDGEAGNVRQLSIGITRISNFASNIDVSINEDGDVLTWLQLTFANIELTTPVIATTLQCV